MRKLLLNTFLICMIHANFSFSSNSQQRNDLSEMPDLLLVEDNKQWSSVNYIGMLEQETKTDILYTKEDTVINDLHYFKLYHTYFENRSQSSYKGAIRQIEDKIYYIEMNEEKEELLYDFGLNVGDEIEIKGNKNSVTKIKYEEFEGITRKIICFDETTSEIDEWIEGIGSRSSLLNSYLWGRAGATTQLLCCQKEGETLYKDKNRDECFIQEPYSYYLTKGTKWTDVSYNWTITQNIDNIYKHEYELKGDTVIDGKVFFKLFHNNLLTGSMYESREKKIYFRSFFDENDHVNRIMPEFIAYGPIEKNKTYLLYSFSNWEVGEEIEYLSLAGDPATEEWAEGTPWLFYRKAPINKIEYVTLIDNNSYKKVGEIIESIGSTGGIFINIQNTPTLMGFRAALYQYYRNGELLYEDAILTSINELKDHGITIQQSASNEILFILNNPSDYEQIQLFDINGVNVQSCKVNGKNEIQLKGLSQGIYLYRILSKNTRNNPYGKFGISY